MTFDLFWPSPEPSHADGLSAWFLNARLVLLLLGLLAGLPGVAQAQAYLPPLGGSGGGQFKSPCPDGQNLTGFDLRAGDDVDAIRPVCVVSYGETAISVPPAITDSNWNGGPGGRVVRLLCPTKIPIVIGIDVAAEGVDTVVVNDIYLYCGKAIYEQAPPANPSNVFNAPPYRISCGLTCGDDPKRESGSQRCPAGQVAVGVHGRSGVWLDAIGLICAAPRLNIPKPGVRSLGRASPTSAPGPAIPICDAARAARARNSPAAANLEAQCRALNAPVTSIGAKPVTAQPSSLAIPVCDAARAARERNSPAAPNLEAKCRAIGGGQGLDQVSSDVQTLDDLATAGKTIADRNPLSSELRSQQPDDTNRRGFDIGMAAAEGHTEWGPGKQKILDSLLPPEQEGFKIAVSFSLDYNRNATNADIGGAIAQTDQVVMLARIRDRDIRYRLGFDIATGIFGDPAQGAQGNKASGPGSLGIRDKLSAPAQRGFNASMKLHLSRSY